MQRRRRLMVNTALVLLFLGGTIVTLVGLVLHEPSWYRTTAIPAGSDRLYLSGQAMNEAAQAATEFGSEEWVVSFTTQQINAFFQEHYFEYGGDANLPPGFSEPRVRFDEGHLRIGVRYKTGLFTTVLTVELKVWQIASESNLVALEIVRLKAGSLPLSPATLLDYISEAARAQNIEVTWYRHEGNPVAVLRFQADQTRPTFQFEEITLAPSKLTISGRAAYSTAPAPK